MLRAAEGHGETECRPRANDERDLHARFSRCGLDIPVKIQEAHHDSVDGLVTHWVKPSSWIRELMRLFPECLTGGFRNTANIRFQLRSFWTFYEGYHPTHAIFSSENRRRLDRVIPLALFGDEGRGPKRGQFLLWSMESVLGHRDLESPSSCRCAGELLAFPLVDALGTYDPDIPSSHEFARAIRQSISLKGHSYITKHLVFGLPSWMYKKHPEVELKHIDLMVSDLQMLGTSGVNVHGEQWYACVVASKGDFKHQVAIGNLNRSYNSIGTTYGNLMCSFCKAGAPGYPFENADYAPIWARTLYDERPWAVRPSLMSISYDESKPEDLLKLDLFHLWKVGLGRDLAGSAVIIYCRLGFWDIPGEGRDLNDRLGWAHASFKLWCLAGHHCAGLQHFSKAFFNLKTFADSAWSNSKGSDTMLINRWLHWFTCLLLQSPTPQSQPHEQLLRIFRRVAEHSFEIMDVCYSHGLWLSIPCAKNLYIKLMCLLRGYRRLAYEAVRLQMVGWGLKPKYHALHHMAYSLRQQILTGNCLALNPMAWGNESNEDTIGKVCRLARKVDVRTITRRVLQRYFLKKRALLKRNRKQR